MEKRIKAKIVDIEKLSPSQSTAPLTGRARSKQTDPGHHHIPQQIDAPATIRARSSMTGRRKSSMVNWAMEHPVVALLIVLGVAIFIEEAIKGFPNRSNSHNTDGVYESALEKMNSNIPLNEREQKRITDIINYDINKRSKEIERKHGER